MQQQIRKQAVRQLLEYRVDKYCSREQWGALLDENFQMTLPITPYRSFHKRDIAGSCRVVRGIEGMMADTASLVLMAECIGMGSTPWKEAIKR